MKNKHITPESIPVIIEALKAKVGAKKQYQVSITIRDNSLKGRQRRLARVFYKTIAEYLGEGEGYAEAHCKLSYGLPLMTRDNKELEIIVDSMLGNRNEEDKIKIIEKYSSWFPLLRDNGGLSVEDTGEYLDLMVRDFAKQSLELISSNEEKLLFCREANK